MSDQEREKWDPKDPALQVRQKAGKWGHEKGFHWVSRARLDDICLHKRVIVRRLFFGRTVVAVQCNQCKVRAMMRRTKRGPAKVSAPMGIERP